MNMKMTLVSAAVAAVLAAPAATLASPTVSGKVGVTLQDQGGTLTFKSHKGQIDVSEDGVDFGGGLKGLYGFEIDGDAVDGTANAVTGTGYLGVQSDSFGKVVVGGFYDVVHNLLDVDQTTSAPGSHLEDNVGPYSQPGVDFGKYVAGIEYGLAANGLTVMADAGDLGQDSLTHKNQYSFQIGAKYEMDPIFVSAAYAKNDGVWPVGVDPIKGGQGDTIITAPTKSLIGVAGGVSLGTFGVNANFSHESGDADAQKVNQLTVNGTATLSEALSAYAQFSTSKAKGGKAANNTAVGVTYHIGKPLALTFEVGKSGDADVQVAGTAEWDF